MHFENPYEILGLETGASEEEVKAAYEKLLLNEEKKAEAKKAYDQICESKKAEAEKPQEPSAETENAEEKPEETEISSEPEQKTEEPEEKKKATSGQIALGVLAVVVLGAVLAALVLSAMGGKNETIVPAETAAATEATAEGATENLEAVPDLTEGTVPPDGDPENETCKGSYTAGEADLLAAADTVVATMGEYELTNAQLQIYYWMPIQ